MLYKATHKATLALSIQALSIRKHFLQAAMPVVFGAAVLGIVVFSAPSANADPSTPKFIAKNGAWSGYSYREDGKKTCYMYAKPEKAEGNYTQRGEVFAFISHRPTLGVFDEVSFDTGYTYKQDSPVKVDIGGANYTLVTEGERAWSNTAAGDKALVKAMRGGAKMIVRGISSRDTNTKDTYSLIGFTATYTAVKEACGK